MPTADSAGECRLGGCGGDVLACLALEAVAKLLEWGVRGGAVGGVGEPQTRFAIGTSTTGAWACQRYQLMMPLRSALFEESAAQLAKLVAALTAMTKVLPGVRPVSTLEYGATFSAEPLLAVATMGNP